MHKIDKEKVKKIQDQFLIAHKFRDYKYRRLSIFGQYNPKNNQLKIYVILCSKKPDPVTKVPDIFDKNRSKELLYDYLYHDSEEQCDTHPIIYMIPSTSESCKKDFMRFCRENYLSHQELDIMIGDSVTTIDGYYNIPKEQTFLDYKSLRIRKLTEKQFEHFQKLYLDKDITLDSNKQDLHKTLVNKITSAIEKNKKDFNPNNN